MTKNDQRTLLWGSITIALLFLLGRGLPRWYQWQRDLGIRSEIADREARSSLFAVRLLGALREAVEKGMTYYVEVSPVLLDADTPIGTGAALVARVDGAVAGTGVQIGTIQPIVDSLSGRVPRVTLRVNMTGDIEGIVQVIEALEAEMPFVAIRGLTVTSHESSPNALQPEVLQTELTLEAIGRPMETDMPVTGDSILQQIPVFPSLSMFDKSLLAKAADSIVVNDVFRADRRPAVTRRGVTSPALVSTQPLPPPPSLSVGGVVGGPPWRAIIIGIPGQDRGAVVSDGDVVGGVSIRAIRRETVVVRYGDSTWTLKTKLQ